VTLTLNGEKVYTSADAGADTDDDIDVELKGANTANDFHFEVPVMEFKTDRKFDMKEGNCMP
jgi:hypothetical protein